MTWSDVLIRLSNHACEREKDEDDGRGERSQEIGNLNEREGAVRAASFIICLHRVFLLILSIGYFFYSLEMNEALVFYVKSVA